MKPFMPVIGALSGMLLTACASIPADHGASAANKMLESRSTVTASVAIDGAQREVEKILAAPLDADATVRLALLQNPRMRGLYTELGLAQAEVYDASRLSNPTLGYLRLAADGGATKTTWSLSQSFTELLFLGYRTRVSRSQLLQAQQRVAGEVLTLEADVRSAYYQYVSADLVAQMRTRMAALTASSAQYAQQLYDAGNISALQRSREQAQASEASIAQRRAVVDAQAAQARLMSLLGLSLSDSGSATKFVVSLPLPQEFTADLTRLQTWAHEQRLDLAALREQVSMFDSNLTHVRHWRWLGGAQLKAERENDRGETFSGLGGELELPLFNQGGGNVMRARAHLEATQARLAALDLQIGNDMAVQYVALQTAQEIVEEYRQRLVPLREQAVAFNQQQQNFMLIGAFELMAARQQEMDTYQSYLQAVRDYWIAYTELLRTAGGNLPADVSTRQAGAAVGVDAFATDATAASPSAQGMDHSGHDMSRMNSNTEGAP